MNFSKNQDFENVGPAGAHFTFAYFPKTGFKTKPIHRNKFTWDLFLRLCLFFREKQALKLNLAKGINF